MPDNMNFNIRPMSISDLGQAIRLSKDEGWNQTENDWRLLLENPDNTCIVAERNNAVAGTATALVHSGRVAWIGMVLVDKTLRGQGAGKMLLKHIINQLKHIESIKLDATPVGQPLYQSLGFIDEYRLFRMTTDSPGNFEYDFTNNEPEITNMDHFQKIVKFDESIFGVERRYLLQKLFEHYPDKAFCLQNKSGPESYIFGRDGIRFNYIGPAGAISDEAARSLIAKTLTSLKNKPVALDIPEEKKTLIRWLESIGFIKQRYFVRMYLKNNPFPGNPKLQYLISGPEFG